MILAPLQCGVFRDLLHPGTYRMERALLKPTSPEAKAVNHSTTATCALEGRAEARSYTRIEIDEIYHRMAVIRRELHTNVRESVAGAEAVVDWGRYTWTYPWVALGAAAAVGYLVYTGSHQKVTATSRAWPRAQRW